MSVSDTWTLAGRTFPSRLIVGTGKYRSIEETRAAIAASGAEMVTVALRRVDLTPGKPSVLDAIDRPRLTLEPRRVAVAVNRDVVPRSAFAGHQLASGDRVEILEAVGGG